MKRGARPLLVSSDLKGPEVKSNLTIMGIISGVSTAIPFSFDLFILSAFLTLTLVVGLSYGQNIKTIQDYALGGKNFSTLTLTATIVATRFGGGFFYNGLSKTYSEGLYFMMADLLGTTLYLLIMGQVLAVRMKDFLQHVSVADAMGAMYGKTARIISAISGIAGGVGFVAIQFQVIARILALFLGSHNELLIILAAAIVIFYSAWGGIRAVTFTDVVQFFTFGTFIPILALIIWNQLQEPQQVITLLAEHPQFQLSQVVGWNTRFISALVLVFYYAMPGINPPTFQRISMARNTKQAQTAYTYAAFIALLVILCLNWVAILLLANNPSLVPSQLVNYLFEAHTYVGFKGLLVVGIIALAMSKADSYLHACAVLLANDLAVPLGFNKATSIVTARFSSFVIGLLALLLALYESDLLSLLLLAGSFYMPIYTVPLLLAIFGFRSSKRAVLISMAAGCMTVVFWRSVYGSSASSVPGMLANLLVLLGSYYLLGEGGGWQKVSPDSPLGLARTARIEAWKKRKEALKNFKLYAYLQQFLPTQEGTFSLLGFYAFSATYIGLYTIDRVNIVAYEAIYTGIYKTVLWAITIFITYPVWPSAVKSKRLMTFFWPLGLWAILFFTGTLLVILSHFHHLQIFVLFMNFFLVTLLIRWPLALILAVSGIGSSLLFFGWYTGLTLPVGDIGPLEFRLLYTFLVFIPFLFAFLDYQKSYRLLGEKNEVLQHRDKDREESLLQLAAEKQAALSALQHTGVGGLLTITRDLQMIPVKKEGKALLESLQKRLLPIAFHLQGIDTKSQDYLRLHITDLPLHSWCEEIKEKATQKGVTARIYCKHDTKLEQITCDPCRLTQLIVDSMVALNAQLEGLEDTPPILFRIEDAILRYPLPDVEKNYIKHVHAVRLAITVGDGLPVAKDSYSPNLGGTNPMTPVKAQDLAKLAGSRIIKSHYGYTEVIDDTLIYVVPVDIQEVRPKDMDKAYMEVDATPRRANDLFTNKGRGVDAQAQEATFLADVAARSEANLDMIQTALETIKWYHGPSTRKSGEPFYLHPLAVAQIVLDYNQDEATIIGALLHDTVEDTPMLLEHIEALFGKQTAEVVDVVTHLQSIPNSIYKVKMSASENLQMLDRTGNRRGLYVKLADRMHNMRTIEGHRDVSKRKLIAQETLDFFVPLAQKLGLKEAAEEFRALCLEVFKQQE